MELKIEETKKLDGWGNEFETIASRGNRLPVGIPNGDELSKDFEIRPWRTKEEREIARFKKPGAQQGTFVANVIGLMCPVVGGLDFESMKEAERTLHVSRMFIADVLYIWVCLRMESMGEKIKMEIGCPNCSKKLPYTGDLSSTEVAVVPDGALESGLRWKYKLHKPVKIRGKEVESFTLAPPRWSIMNVQGARNDATAKIAAIRGAVCGINDEPAVLMLSDTEVDELSKRDLEAISTAVDDRFLGPNMALEGVCPPSICPIGGDQTFRAPINWSYDSFFGSSSQ